MIRHIVAWNFRENLTDSERFLAGQRIKSGLESLREEIEGILSMEVFLRSLESGHRQIMLFSLFRSEEDLVRYQSHPAHKRVSDYVGTVAEGRICLDFPAEEGYTFVTGQPVSCRNRMEDISETSVFRELPADSLFHTQGVLFSYGWLKESGAPPGRCMDVILVGNRVLSQGEEAAVRPVGCFLRSSGDHKLVAVETVRQETDFSQLPESEREACAALCPRIGEGEGWFGADAARKLIRNYFHAALFE